MNSTHWFSANNECLTTKTTGARESPIPERYRGEFADGQKHGTGTFKWDGGASYSGEFVEDGSEAARDAGPTR